MNHADNMLAAAKLVFSAKSYKQVTLGLPARALEDAIAAAAAHFAMPDAPRRDVITRLFAWCRCRRRDEYVFRCHLHTWFHRNDPTSFVINQVPSLDRVLDIMHVTTSRLHVYEIKSPLDSPLRVADQLTAARAITPHVTLLVDHTQADTYAGFVDDDTTGFATLGPRGGIQTLKPARATWESLDTQSCFDLMRRDEKNLALAPEHPTLAATSPANHYRTALAAARKVSPKTLHQRMHNLICQRPTPDLAHAHTISAPLSPLLATVKPGKLHTHRLTAWLAAPSTAPTPAMV